jgi:hypothetical protein
VESYSHTVIVKYQDPITKMVGWVQIFYAGTLPESQARTYEPEPPAETVEPPSEAELEDATTITGTPTEIGMPEDAADSDADLGFKPDDVIDISDSLDTIETINTPDVGLGIGDTAEGELVVVTPVDEDGDGMPDELMVDVPIDSLPQEDTEQESTPVLESIPDEVVSLPVKTISKEAADTVLNSIAAKRDAGDFAGADALADEWIALVGDKMVVGTTPEQSVKFTDQLSAAKTATAEAKTAAKTAAEQPTQQDPTTPQQGSSGGENSGGNVTPVPPTPTQPDPAPSGPIRIAYTLGWTEQAARDYFASIGINVSARYVSWDSLPAMTQSLYPRGTVWDQTPGWDIMPGGTVSLSIST